MSNSRGNALSWALIAVGTILSGVFIVKMSIIGYYPSELPTYAVVGGSGLALIAIGTKVRDHNDR